MKTRKNINLKTKMSFAAATLFVFSTLGSVNASESENKVIFERLQRLSNRMEETIKYKAPAEPEATTYILSDDDAAEKRVEEFNQVLEQSLLYEAPDVAEDIEEYEVQVAVESIDNLAMVIEESIKF